MALTTRKNLTVKALQALMAKEKKTDSNVKLEWEMACNTNNQRGHVYDQHEINELYSRYSRHRGATKACHIKNHFGEEFKYIVVKRHQVGGYLPELRNDKATGNQLVDEINCWVEYAELEEADLLCPILKYFTSKSDQVTATSETMQKNVVIIAQKAIFIGDAEDACKEAERLNKMSGYEYENWEDRYNKLSKLSRKQHWRDAMFNSGNSGVIFDYNKGCYKAVFIDYAL